jgi:hypothetical protein
VTPPTSANVVAPLPDWTDPAEPASAYTPLVPVVDADGNETSGILLPDIAVPRGTYTGWNIYKAPHPAGELADRDGTFLAFAATRAERETAGDPRLSIAERAPEAPRRREAAVALVRDRLLLAEDAAVWN